MSKKTIFAFVLLFALAISYMIWLDSGCEHVGVITWEGKVCYEDLLTN